MLADIVDVLRCRVCAEPLALEGRVLSCASGHAFDVAKQGYVNLLGGRDSSSTADTPAMVTARRDFLCSGAYEPIAEAIAAAVSAAVPDSVPGVFLDAGAGTGYYLASLLDRFPERTGVALDLSKHAARAAAGAHPRIGSIVADVWAPFPVRDASAALVLVVFSPRNAEEFARVLAPGGRLVIVTPNPEHLLEIVGPLGLISVDPRKRERLELKLGGLFEPVSEQIVTYPLTLTREEALAAVSMGPTGAHLTAEEIETRLAELPEPLDVTVSVTVGTYQAATADSAES